MRRLGRGERVLDAGRGGVRRLCRDERVLDGGRGRGRLCGVFGGDDPYMRIISVSHAALSPLPTGRGSGAGGLL